jgi:hypothetical protein
MPISFRSSGRSPFPLPNEAEIKQNRKEHSLDDGTHAADLGRLNEARAQKRHRNADHVKVKKSSRVHKERTCKKLADLLPLIFRSMFFKFAESTVEKILTQRRVVS